MIFVAGARILLVLALSSLELPVAHELGTHPVKAALRN